MQGAWKVGLLVIVFVGLLLGAYAVLKKSLFAPQTQTYFAIFDNAGGVTPGTAVQLAGVPIGQVARVDLMPAGDRHLARVVLNIEKGFGIPVGSTALLPTGLIGLSSSPIQIQGGSSTAYLPAGSEIPGRLGSPLESLLPNAEQTMEELNKILVATRKLLEDQDLKGDVRKLLQTSEKTVASFQGLAGKFNTIATRVDSLIAMNQPVLNQTMRDAAAAMRDVQKTTALVAEMAADPALKEKTLGLLDSLNSTTKRAEELVVSLNDFVNDPKLRQPLEATMANTAKMTETGTRVAENAEVMSKNGITITEKAITLADKANDIADEAKKLLEKVGGVLGKTPSAGILSGISARMDLFRETKPNRYRTDVELSVPFRDNTFHVGLFDAFESNKVTLQLGKTFAPGSEYRYGIYASKPGVGVDYMLAPRLFMRGDLFDLNNPRFDLRARYDFGNGFFGWVGVNQLFKRNAPIVGIGIQK